MPRTIKLQSAVRITLMLLALAIAACSTTPSSPSSAVINGTWRITSIQPASQPMQTAPVGATYDVTFDGARISARVDCNTCNGSFMMNGSALTIGPALACTRAACATAAFESAVVTILTGEHQVSSSSNTLTLTSSRGAVMLQR